MRGLILNVDIARLKEKQHLAGGIQHGSFGRSVRIARPVVRGVMACGMRAPVECLMWLRGTCAFYNVDARTANSLSFSLLRRCAACRRASHKGATTVRASARRGAFARARSARSRPAAGWMGRPFGRSPAGHLLDKAGLSPGAAVETIVLCGGRRISEIGTMFRGRREKMV